MLKIMNSKTGKMIGYVWCAHPSLADLNDLRTTINIETGFAYSLIWSNHALD